MLKIFSSFFLIITAFFSFSQQPVGSWQDYLSHNKINHIVKAQEKIYCATDKGLFYYDLSDNSIQRVSPIDELSDLCISHLNFFPSENILFIGYKNGNIDLVINNKFHNIAGIKNKSFLGDKTINHSTLEDKIILVSTGFGIIEINIEKLEIADSYIFGNETYLNVNSCLIYNEILYAFTNNGIYTIDQKEGFRPNFGNWEIMANTMGNEYKSAIEFNNTLYCIKNENSIDFWNGKAWDSEIVYNGIYFLSAGNGEILVGYKYGVRHYNSDFVSKGVYSSWKKYFSGTLGDDYIWLGHTSKGLIKIARENGVQDTIIPNSPYSNNNYRMLFANNSLWVTQGSHNGYSWPLAYLYKDDSWYNFEAGQYPAFDTIRNIVDFAVPFSNSNKWYAACFRYGVIEFDGQKIKHVYEASNTPTLSTDLIGGIDSDNDGNVWISLQNSNKPIAVKTPDGTFESLKYSFAIGKAEEPRFIVCTSWGQIWTLVNRSNSRRIMVLDPGTTPIDQQDDQSWSLNLYDEENDKFGQNFNCLVEDKNQTLWVGTDDGVLVIDNPQNLPDDGKMDARQPELIKFGNILKPLLEGELVTSIVVDGANRKWIGTVNGGLFLVSEDGTEEIYNFNTGNSALFSNTIMCLEMNDETGELFIGTDQGILSFFTTATEGKDNYSSISAFPNPVRPEYTGPITIKGLMYQSEVNITDVSGNLVYSAISNGGTVLWNGEDQTGNPVVSGTYLVYVASSDAKQAEVSKILIIR
jgi:hypothetical protein